MAIRRNRESMSRELNRIAERAKQGSCVPGQARGVMLEEPTAGNLHGGVCEGGTPTSFLDESSTVSGLPLLGRSFHESPG